MFVSADFLVVVSGGREWSGRKKESARCLQRQLALKLVVIGLLITMLQKRNLIGLIMIVRQYYLSKSSF